MRSFRFTSAIIIFAILGSHPLPACQSEEIAQLLRRAQEFFDRRAYAESLQVEEGLLRCLESMTSPDPRDLAANLTRQAELNWSLGRLRTAEAQLKRAAGIYESRLGTAGRDYAAVLTGLAAVYSKRNRPLDAEPLLRRAVEVHERLQSRDLDGLTAALNNLGELYVKLGDLEGADRAFRRALAAGGEKSSEGVRAAVLYNLACVQIGLGSPVEAERLLRNSLDLRMRLYGTDHPDVQSTSKLLAGLIKDHRR